MINRVILHKLRFVRDSEREGIKSLNADLIKFGVEKAKFGREVERQVQKDWNWIKKAFSLISFKRK